jgi:SAM-dependent methyltransferase
VLPELYHAHHCRHLDDLPFWLDQAAKSGDPILELGCGTGRVLMPLAQAGHHCIGLDHDLGMLQFLRHTFNLHTSCIPLIVAADMSRFRLAIQFSLVILPCNTISTLDEEMLRTCLGCVRQHLRSGGLFAASLPNPEVLLQVPARSQLQFEEEFQHPGTGHPVLVSSGWRRTKRLFKTIWTYDVLYPDGTVKRSIMKSVHHLRTERAYLEAFQSAGLNILDIFGDFDYSGYSNDSPNLIILASA